MGDERPVRQLLAVMGCQDRKNYQYTYVAIQILRNYGSTDRVSFQKISSTGDGTSAASFFYESKATCFKPQTGELNTTIFVLLIV